MHSDLFKKAFKWLNAPDPEANYNAALALREPEAGSRLINSATYSDWKNGSTRHLWLHGKAGCVKSVISATIVEDIRKHCQGRADLGCAMFYFAFDDASK